MVGWFGFDGTLNTI